MTFDSIVSVGTSPGGRIRISGHPERMEEILRFLDLGPDRLRGEIRTAEGGLYGRVVELVQVRRYLGKVVAELIVEEFEVLPSEAR